MLGLARVFVVSYSFSVVATLEKTQIVSLRCLAIKIHNALVFYIESMPKLFNNII